MRYAKKRTDVTVSQPYEVSDGPLFYHKNMTLQPASVRFDFLNGKLERVEAHGRMVLKDGSMGERVILMPKLYAWNLHEWPAWLLEIHASAVKDLGFGGSAA